MAKDKKGSKAVAAAPTPATSKPLEAVKSGRVTKVENAKAVAKDAAKKAVKEVEKTKKKAKKDPSPEPSSDEDDGTSESSASSDDDSGEESDIESEGSGSDSGSSSGSDSDEEDVPKKAEVPKANGVVKAAVNGDADDSDSSNASGSDDDEAPKVNGKTAAASGGDDGSDDDSSSSSGSSEPGSDDEDAKAGAEKVKPIGAEADGADSSSASSSDEEESDQEIVPKIEEAVKKRKAEEALDPTPKKTKTVNVNGEDKVAASNLFIGNLSWNIDEEWLTREFEEFGEITGVRVITDRDSGRSKGYGYVDFTHTDSAIKALEAKNGEMLDGRNIRVDFSVPRQQKNDNFTPQQRSFDRAQRYGDVPKEPSATLFVGNISFGADETMVSDLFQDYGTINAVRLPTDKETGEMKGYGYVEFSSIDEATAAFEACQGASIADRPIRLDYASGRSNNDSPRGGSWSRTPRGGRGGFSDRGGRGGGRGGFNDRGRGRGGARGGRGGTTNRGGFGDFSGKKISF